MPDIAAAVVNPAPLGGGDREADRQGRPGRPMAWLRQQVETAPAHPPSLFDWAARRVFRRS